MWREDSSELHAHTFRVIRLIDGIWVGFNPCCFRQRKLAATQCRRIVLLPLAYDEHTNQFGLKYISKGSIETMKASFDNLVIEVTRRCNMGCAHCMRGNAQDKDITEAVVDCALAGTEHIGCLTLTGGEPSLNVPAIRYITKRIKELKIDLGSVYMVTNGKEVSDEFMLACLELYMLTYDNDFNGLALSIDQFHETVPKENINKLSKLAAFNMEDKNVDFKKVPVIDLGRAESLSGYRKRDRLSNDLYIEYDERYEGSVRIESTIAITVDGDILSDCDYAYDDTEDIRIGNVFDGDWIKKMVDTYEVDTTAA